MKNLFKVIATACAVCLTAVSARAETDLSFAVLISPPGPEFEALDLFVKRVEELSQGDLKISIFPGGQLGNTRENIEQLGVGQVALALHGDELISGLAPEYSAVITPFVFPSTEAVFDFWKSDAGKAALAEIEARGGIKVIGIMRRGQRQLTANKPVAAPADLAGLKLRIPEIASWIDIWSSLGAKPAPVTFTEVFGALQMGVIDGQENPCIIIEQAKLYEVQNYLMMTSHLPVAWYWGMSKKVYDTLTKTQRDVLMKAAAEAAEFGDTRTATLEKESCDRLVSERGMTLVTPDRDAFKNDVIPAIDTLSKSWSPEMRKYLEDNLK